ncbi:hypothetical protein GBA52_025083 [Prunus armeniaca]|nr:hypothetical protein GBA52_025083 [Prunus armeniaca]
MLGERSLRNFLMFFIRVHLSISRKSGHLAKTVDENEEKEIGPKIPEIPVATALSEAGIKFERGLNNNLMNIEFKDGVLTITALAVTELTEPLFRKLIGFEQWFHDRSQQITSYAVFMD